MRQVIPSQRVREEFNLIYELYGCKRAINYLSRYFKIRRMKIVVDGRKVGNGDDACYDYYKYTAYFKKKELNKFNVLHEFYHHITYLTEWEISERTEEKEANGYAKEVINSAR